jgi:Concanavalin A-like lectin/glucanases superfamily
MPAFSTPVRSSNRGSRTRRFASTSATAGALLCIALAASASPGAAAPASSTDAGAGKVTTEFRYNFDNGETLKPGTKVRDVSGHNHPGTVVVSGSGHLKRVTGVSGIAAKFPRQCRKCGRALINLPDDRSLRPQRHPFTFGAAVRATPTQTRRFRDPNIVQKGYINGAGGQYKLELVGSHPRCVVAGRGGLVKVKSPISINDGTWHKLTCNRNGRVLTLRIDGRHAATAQGRIGRITTTAPIRIGGKGVGAASGNDQYHGSVDNVFLTINRR